VVEIAQGINTSTTKKVDAAKQEEIRSLFKEILDTSDL
jgi:hypothetical protein